MYVAFKNNQSGNVSVNPEFIFIILPKYKAKSLLEKFLSWTTQIDCIHRAKFISSYIGKLFLLSKNEHFCSILTHAYKAIINLNFSFHIY